jgi:hypothetical protein
MKHFRTLFSLIVLLISTVALHAQSSLGRSEAGPLFVENRGQWPTEARFLSRLPGLDLWIGDQGLVYDIYRREQQADASIKDASAIERVGHVVGMRFIGAEPSSRAFGVEALPSRFNYAAGGADLVSAGTYREGSIRGLYKGIDLILHIEQGSPRYDFIVAAGADPSKIRIGYDGAGRVGVDRDGSLRMTTSMGDVTHQGLYAYQTINGTQQKVACAFAVDPKGVVGFRLGDYDRSRPLVIDPLVYSTFLGGAADDFAHAIAVDAAGNTYVTGSTFSINYPTTLGAYRQTMLGGEWVFVTKLNATATGLPVYSTFIGPGHADAIRVDSLGNAYITGTAGTNYPTTPGALAASSTGADVFVTKVSSSGAALVWSALVGPGRGTAIALNGGTAFVTGSTNSRSFPTTVGVLKRIVNGTGPDAFVAKVNANGTALLYSTLLGGTGSNAGNAIAVNAAGEAFVAGETNAANFPTTASAVQTVKGIGMTYDAFLVRLGIMADTLVYGTYLGGDANDYAYGLAINSSNEAFVAGWTLSSDFPTSGAAYRPSPYDSNDAFVARVGAAGDTLLYSTYLGSSGIDIAREVAVDGSNNAYVAGTTGGSNFPITRSHYQGVYAGSVDGFVTKFPPNGKKLLYSTYIGGGANDSLDGMVVDAAGDIYVTGSTFSPDFPTTAGVAQPIKLLGSDLFITKINILRVLKPNGGEIVCANSVDTIRWTGGTNATYDIYISNNQGASFNLLASNVIGNSYLWPVGALRPDTTYRIRVITSNDAESDTSDANFTVNDPAVITAEPVATSGSSGGSVVFTSIGTGTPKPSIQWQVDNGSGWVDIVGAMSPNLTLNGLRGSQNGNDYRVIYSNGCGSDTSQTARLSVSELSILTPNGGEAICSGTDYQITWNAIGTVGPYRLELSSDGGVNWTTLAPSVSDSSYTWNLVKTLGGSRYRVRIVLPPGNTRDISNADFTINSTPVVTKQPTDYTVVSGSALTFDADAISYPDPTMQWEVNDGTGWKQIPNATTKSIVLYDATVAMSGYKYRAIFTTICGSDTTRAATATVTPNPLGVDRRNDAARELQMSLAPNPARRYLDVRFTLPKAGLVEVTLTDMLGRGVMGPISATKSAGEGSIPIDLGSLSNGTYIVTLRSGNRTATTQVTVAK